MTLVKFQGALQVIGFLALFVGCSFARQDASIVDTEWVYDPVWSPVVRAEERGELEKVRLRQHPILPRFLENATTDGPPPDHHTCETALEVQPSGPGDEVFLLEQDTSQIDSSIERRFPCDDYAFEGNRILYYKLQGTGNPFYITTCQYPFPPTEEQVNTRLEMAANLNCSDLDTRHECIEDNSGSIYQCPNETDGVSFAFLTQVDTDYTFSVQASGPGIFNLKVGELQPPGAIANSCDEPEEIVLPPINNTGATRADPFSVSVPLLRDNHGIFNMEFEEICGTSWLPSSDYATGGRWFALDAPEVAAEILFSTCSNETTLHSTFLGILLVRDNAPGNATCNPESLMCFGYSRIGYGCDAFAGALASETVITKPGERYLIYVSNQYPFDYGNFLLNVTVEIPPSSFFMSRDEETKREKRRPGVTCDTDQRYLSAYDALVCRDGCLYCEAEDSLLDSVCFNRTDAIDLDSEYNAEFVGYELSVDYYKGRNETFVYEELSDDTCRVVLQDVECSGCEKQDCGAPLINCTNVPGIQSSMWDQESLDLCQATTTVFSYAAQDHNTEGTCDTFMSQIACNNSAEELATEGLTCTCTLDETQGSSNLMCSTDCGLFCNKNQSVCGVRDFDDWYFANGEVDKQDHEFNYVVGGPEDSGPYTLYVSNGYCRLGRYWSDCDECEPKQCETGARSPLGLGVVLNCTNHGNGAGAYDTCNADLLVEEGPFQFLSGEFEECLDIVPPNAKCQNAIPFQLNESVLGSNVYVPKKDYDTAFCDHTDSGLYYSIQGNGGWYRASTCANETDFIATVRLVEGSSCDEEMNTTCRTDMFASTCGENGRYLEWKTEEGKDYIIFVGGFEKGTFNLQIEEFEYIDPLTHCEDKLQTVANPDECECVEYEEYQSAALECLTSCERCGGLVQDTDYCSDEMSWATAFNNNGAYRVRKVYNMTAGFNGTVAVDLFLGEFCRAAIGDFIDITICDCDMVSCADGSMNSAVNCSDYGEGYYINFCEDELPPENVLSVLLGEPFGACSEEGPATQVVEKSSPTSNAKPPPSILESEDIFGEIEEPHSSAAHKAISSCGLLLVLQLCLF